MINLKDIDIKGGYLILETENNEKIKTEIYAECSMLMNEEKEIIGTELLIDTNLEYEKYKFKGISINHKSNLIDALKINKKENKVAELNIVLAYRNWKEHKKNDFFYSINMEKEDLESKEFLEFLTNFNVGEPEFFETLKLEILEDPNIDFNNETTIKILSLAKQLGANITQDDLNDELVKNKRLDKLINCLENLPVGEVIEKNEKLEYKFLRDEKDNIIKKNQLDKLRVKIDQPVVNQILISEIFKEKSKNINNSKKDLNTLKSILNQNKFKFNKFKDKNNEKNLKNFLTENGLEGIQYKDLIKYYENPNESKLLTELYENIKENTKSITISEIFKKLSKHNVDTELTFEWVTDENTKKLIQNYLSDFKPNEFNIDIIYQGDAIENKFSSPILAIDKVRIPNKKKENYNNKEFYPILDEKIKEIKLKNSIENSSIKNKNKFDFSFEEL